MAHTSVRLLPGDRVRIRPWSEIQATLDKNGMFEGLPFMAEMLPFCGSTFTVSKHPERACEEARGEMRRIRNVVFLDSLRCDGSAHGGCHKGCLFFWKEPWLERLEDPVSGTVRHVAEPIMRDESRESGGSELTALPSVAVADDQFTCQSTELMAATSALSPFDLRCYVRDIRSRTYSVPELTRILLYAAWLRLRRILTGRSYRVLQGEQHRTPVESLDLQPGEWVQVKTPEEIVRTLDKDGKNRGLAFTVEMERFCGGRFRVLRRLERMIHEPTRKLLSVSHTVILEGVVCDGCHILRGGCPRENYHFWREIWLRRV